MPLYNFKCKECGAEIEKFFKIADRPETLECLCECCKKETEFCSVLSSPAIVYGVYRANAKMSGDFKDRMGQIRKQHPNMVSKYV